MNILGIYYESKPLIKNSYNLHKNLNEIFNSFFKSSFNEVQ